MTDSQLAQMALSAIIRSGERVDIITLNETLRGHTSRSVKALGMDQIKTYGAGKLLSKEQWMYVLIQMVQKELFTIDYADNYALKVTESGHRVLKGGEEVVFYGVNRFRMSRNANYEKHNSSSALPGLNFKRNGIQINIEEDLSNVIDWKDVVNRIQSEIYWNYKSDSWINVNRFIPNEVAEYDRVKTRLLDIVRDVYHLQIQDDFFFIPKKDDFDINGVLVEPLKLPFDECLQKLRDFIVANGRYPSMKAEEEEVALRKWFRECWHGINPLSPEQKGKLSAFTHEFPRQNGPIE